MKLLLAIAAVVCAFTFTNVQPAEAQATRTASVSVCGGGGCRITYTTYTLSPSGQWVATSSYSVWIPDLSDIFPAVEY